MSVTSKHLKFDGMPNTRDLDGMLTKDNRTIKNGLLFRSGHLSRASEADKKILGELIDLDIDFRTVDEKEHQPDQTVDGCTYLELPILDEDGEIEGVARDYESIQKVFEEMRVDPNAGVNHMYSIYRSFITNKKSVKGYKTFVKTLLNHEGKGVLWHCSAGKDRCGMATVIIQEILGVSREDIYADYLMTNEYNKDDAKMYASRFIEKCGIQDDELKNGIYAFWTADRRFLDAMYQKADEVYGSFDNYLEQALGVTKEIKDKLKQKYLG